MRRAGSLALALLLALSAVSTAPPAASARTAPDVPGAADADAKAPLSAEGRYIVVLKPNRDPAAASDRAARHGVALDRTFRHAVRGFAARLTPAQLRSVQADPDVARVVPDELIGLAAQAVPTGVRRVQGRQSTIAAIDGTGPGVDADVAIVDTGIGGTSSRAHEDLNVAGGVSCSTENPNSWGDPNGHGTHVAGTVGAIDNGIGVVGVAPGVRLWSVRILDSAGNGLVSWYVCGLDWIAAQRDPADPGRPLFEAVNMSVAKRGEDDGSCGLVNDDVMHQAVCRLVASGVTVVAAAGNDGFNARNLRPASYDEVITVSALADTDGQPGGTGGALCYSWSTYDRDDTFADFSNYGADVDLIAPGKCIWSTFPGNRYGYLSGTSMAAPHVAGAAALYKASRPDATPAQVRDALLAAGTLDWNTETDPDTRHEPLLDVSHLVALGDFTVDLTPGVTPSILVGSGAGRTVDLPARVIRAEDVPGPVDLVAVAEAPLTASVAHAQLAGPGAVSTTLTVTVPAGTPSGRYGVTLRGSDGTRHRSATLPVRVDGTPPAATAPAIALRSGGRLDNGVTVAASWPAATDTSGITRYEARWILDGTPGSAFALPPSTRQAVRELHPGRVLAIEIRARDGVGNWSPWARSSGFAPRLSQDTSPSLVREGPWTRYRGTWVSGGTAIHARAKDALVRRAFTGRGIAWIGSRGPTRGKARLYADGTYLGTVDLRRATTAHRVVLWARSWPVAGPHRVTVKVVGTAGRPRVDVDAFVIVP